MKLTIGEINGEMVHVHPGGNTYLPNTFPQITAIRSRENSETLKRQPSLLKRAKSSVNPKIYFQNISLVKCRSFAFTNTFRFLSS